MDAEKGRGIGRKRGNKQRKKGGGADKPIGENVKKARKAMESVGWGKKGRIEKRELEEVRGGGVGGKRRGGGGRGGGEGREKARGRG